VNDDELERMTGSGGGLILRYYAGIHLKGLRRTAKIPIRIAGGGVEI
jgi:hypothetical protein